MSAMAGMIGKNLYYSDTDGYMHIVMTGRPRLHIMIYIM